MEDDKYKKYYSFIDCFGVHYSYPKELQKYEDDDEYLCFEFANPIYFDVLMNYLEFIMRQLCHGNSRETSEKIIDEIKNTPDANNDKYHYLDITLGSLVNADYEFLKKHFIIKWDLIKNENDFNNNLHFEEAPDIIYPFSLRELYNVLLPRAIKVTLDNYYIKKKNRV